jgi:D-alanyl-D-alanine carboxypeptidase
MWLEASDKSYVQPPGHSEHQTGLAIDISASEMKAESWEWLAENCAKRGFILRYPPGKEEVTGISHEPWHFRYVGIPHAQFCHESSMCLEEYISCLIESEGYMMEVDGAKYTVSRIEPEDGRIDAPGVECSISRDNMGGYILTYKEAS